MLSQLLLRCALGLAIQQRPLKPLPHLLDQRLSFLPAGLIGRQLVVRERQHLAGLINFKQRLDQLALVEFSGRQIGDRSDVWLDLTVLNSDLQDSTLQLLTLISAHRLLLLQLGYWLFVQVQRLLQLKGQLLCFLDVPAPAISQLNERIDDV